MDGFVKTPHRDTLSGRLPSGPRPRLTGAQVVYAALRQAIIVLDIEPGAALEEEQLCRQYNVSRTPVREALIRLASEGLVELEPNRGAKVASLQFVDVVDHYEAMDILQPVIWHFAAVRRTDTDLDVIKKNLEEFGAAVAREDAESIIRSNYEIHRSIAAACHNRSLEKAYRQMLVDKLRVAQHAIRGLTRDRGHVLALRLTGAFRILKRLVPAIALGDGSDAERLAREYNSHVREQIIDILSTSLAKEITLPRPRPINHRSRSG
jgi:DNA-binding GntR family transcriptional regulator